MMEKANEYVETQMMIRKDSATVFEAFVDPKLTSQFWFTHGSGRMQEGIEVHWTWEMYDFQIKVLPTLVKASEKIVFQWYSSDDVFDIVEINILAIADHESMVTIRNYGFHEKGDDLYAKLKDAAGGWAIVLSGLKCYLEHGIKLNLIADKFPISYRNYLAKSE